MPVLTAIGLTSGSPLDGVGAALVRTDGETFIERGPAVRLPYARDLKVAVRRAAKAAAEARDGAADIGKASAEVTAAHARAVERVLGEGGLDPGDIDIVGFHGHTILHRPSRSPEISGRTWQIGDGALLAELTRIDVVSDFRSADIAAGGEGSPLSPVFFCALARQTDRDGAVGVLSLDRVASLTFVPASRRESDLIAFDCGPGAGLLNEWMELKTGEASDADGTFARQGRVRTDILRMMLLNPYIRRRPPKSLDRCHFKLDPLLSLSAMDGAATLTAFTAASVRAAETHLPEPPAIWIALGEGRQNPALMDALAKALTAPVIEPEAAGWRSDEIDAAAIAFLAVRSVQKMPLTFPKTTRVPRPTPGGALHRAAP